MLDERFLDALDAVADLEEVVVVVLLDAERLAHRGLVGPGGNDDCEFGDLRLHALRATRLGSPAEANVVAEVEAIAAVLLADAARLEPASDVVLGDPDLIVAVGEVGGVDELQVVGQLLADREPRARVGLVGDQRRLDPDLAEAGRLLESAPETRTRPVLPDTRAPARGRPRTPRRACRRACGPVTSIAMMSGSGSVGTRRQRGLGVAGRAGDGDGDVVGAGGRVEAEIERRARSAARRRT